jgi:hypothetical protein
VKNAWRRLVGSPPPPDQRSDSIPLDEYVRETLLGIVKGVLDAQTDERCGPYIGRAPKNPPPSLNVADDGAENTVSLVSFDLATTHEAKLGGGIKVIPFPGFGADARGEAAASLVNRIRFVVTTSIPKPDAQRAEQDRRKQAADAEFRRGRERHSTSSDGWMSR